MIGGNAFTRITPTPDGTLGMDRPIKPCRKSASSGSADLKNRYPTPHTGTPISSEPDQTITSQKPGGYPNSCTRKRTQRSFECANIIVTQGRPIDETKKPKLGDDYEDAENVSFGSRKSSRNAMSAHRHPFHEVSENTPSHHSDFSISDDPLFCDEEPFAISHSRVASTESLDFAFGHHSRSQSRVHTPVTTFSQAEYSFSPSQYPLSPYAPSPTPLYSTPDLQSSFTFTQPIPSGVKIPDSSVKPIRPIAQYVTSRPFFTSSQPKVQKPKLKVHVQEILKHVHGKTEYKDIEQSIRQLEFELEQEQFFEGIRNVDIINRHPEITIEMWEMVCNWLLEVATDHVMFRKTFHLALHLFACYMSKQSNQVTPTLQMLAVSCIYVAAKIEETEPQVIEGFVEFVRENAAPDEVEEQFQSAILLTHKYEHKIMNAIEYRLCAPTSIDYLNRFFQYASIVSPREISSLPPLLSQVSMRTLKDDSYTSRYDGILFSEAASILDKAIMCYDSLGYSYSVLAASALWLVYTTHLPTEQARFELTECVTGHKKSELRDCISFLSGIKAEDIPKIVSLPIIERFVEIATNQMSPYNIIYHQLPLASLFETSQ